MTKKILVLLGAALFALGLAGCNKAEEASEAPAAAVEAPAAEAPDASPAMAAPAEPAAEPAPAAPAEGAAK